MSFNPFSCRGSNRTELIVETIQRIGGFLSTFGSSLILSDIAKKVRNGKETDPYQRIMVGMSIFDILYSFFLFFLGTWMAPVETGSLWAKGNMASCTAQGFFFMFGGSGEVVSYFTCFCLVLFVHLSHQKCLFHNLSNTISSTKEQSHSISGY